MKKKILGLALALYTASAFAQKPVNQIVAGIPVNYAEEKAGDYTLPSLMKMNDGKAVANVSDWKKRRAEILRLVEENQFGKMPAAPEKLNYSFTEDKGKAFEGTAIRKQINVYLTGDTQQAGNEVACLSSCKGKHLPHLYYSYLF